MTPPNNAYDHSLVSTQMDSHSKKRPAPVPDSQLEHPRKRASVAVGSFPYVVSTMVVMLTPISAISAAVVSRDATAGVPSVNCVQSLERIVSIKNQGSNLTREPSLS